MLTPGYVYSLPRVLEQAALAALSSTSLGNADAVLHGLAHEMLYFEVVDMNVRLRKVPLTDAARSRQHR